MLLPSPVRADVLLTLLDAVASVSETSVEYVQGYLFNKYWYNVQGATSDTRTTICTLVNDVFNVKAFFTLTGSGCFIISFIIICMSTIFTYALLGGLHYSCGAHTL
jgi:hypothetical protein